MIALPQGWSWRQAIWLDDEPWAVHEVATNRYVWVTPGTDEIETDKSGGIPKPVIDLVWAQHEAGGTEFP
jgi:hypothetical protein